MTSPTVTEQTTETGAKRVRIDVDALAKEKPHERVSLNVALPAEMKVILRQAAEKSNVSETQFVRDLIANRLKYTVPESFNERGRRGSFAGMTEEEKKAAQKAQQEKKRDTVSKILEAAVSGEIPEEVLAALGISKADLPTVRGKRGKKEESAA